MDLFYWITRLSYLLIVVIRSIQIEGAFVNKLTSDSMPINMALSLIFSCS